MNEEMQHVMRKYASNASVGVIFSDIQEVASENRRTSTNAVLKYTFL
jgi:hypothetical protein